MMHDLPNYDNWLERPIQDRYAQDDNPLWDNWADAIVRVDATTYEVTNAEIEVDEDEDGKHGVEVLTVVELDCVGWRVGHERTISPSQVEAVQVDGEWKELA